MGIKLDEILPVKPEFELKKMGKTYVIRLPTLADRPWIKNKFGGQQALAKIFDYNDPDWSAVSKIVYHHLEDKSDFLSGEMDFIDDEGVKSKKIVSGPDKLFHCLANVKEGLQMMSAMTKASLLAEPTMTPVIEKMLSKKNLKMAKRN